MHKEIFIQEHLQRLGKNSDSLWHLINTLLKPIYLQLCVARKPTLNALLQENVSKETGTSLNPSSQSRSIFSIQKSGLSFLILLSFMLRKTVLLDSVIQYYQRTEDFFLPFGTCLYSIGIEQKFHQRHSSPKILGFHIPQPHLYFRVFVYARRRSKIASFMPISRPELLIQQKQFSVTVPTSREVAQRFGLGREPGLKHERLWSFI